MMQMITKRVDSGTQEMIDRVIDAMDQRVSMDDMVALLSTIMLCYEMDDEWPLVATSVAVTLRENKNRPVSLN